MPHSNVALREWCERSEVPFLSNFIHQQPEFALQALRECIFLTRKAESFVKK